MAVKHKTGDFLDAEVGDELRQRGFRVDRAYDAGL